MNGVRIRYALATILANSIKFLLTFVFHRFISLQTQLIREYSDEPTKRKPNNEVSGECLVPVSFERLHHVCAS